MKQTIAILGSVLLASAAFAAGCSDDETTAATSAATSSTGPGAGGGDGGTGGTGTGGAGTGGDGGDGGSFPPPPALGDQIDRMGRPAVNTALVDNFVTAAGAVSDSTVKAASQDAYNQNDDPSTWITQYQTTMARNLAIIDAVDAGPTATGAGCGTQLALGCTVPADPSVAADWDDNIPCYGNLAAVLSFDMLVVKGDTTTCTQYLGVEANALGIENNDCGGRKPAYDVIETTYSALAGTADVVEGFDDGVAAGSQSQVEVFPYLAEPFSD